MNRIAWVMLAALAGSYRTQGQHRGFRWRIDPTRDGYELRILVPDYTVWPAVTGKCFVLSTTHASVAAAKAELRDFVQVAWEAAQQSADGPAWFRAARNCKWTEGPLVS